jgi:pantothenate kinase type III
MQGLITIDFGNTNPHAGVFQKTAGTWDLVKVVPFAELPILLGQLQLSAHNTSIVLSDVKSREDELQTYIDQGYLLTRLKDYWRGTRFAGMPVHYAKSLGEDRLIGAFYAYKKLKEAVLLIDAGTFTTIDVVTREGFQGGYIVPGFSSYATLYQGGENLKSYELNFSFEDKLPQETHQAMAGSYSAFGSLANELIQKHALEKVLLTGGQSSLWEGFFAHPKTPLVVEHSPHLIHWALHYWMTTQIEPL